MIGNVKLVAAVLIGVFAVPAGARADAAAGARMALQWCSQCHVVNNGAPPASIPQGPPAFRAIAARLDDEQLRAFLTHPHGAMPDLGLTRAEINDLIDYIRTLR